MVKKVNNGAALLNEVAKAWEMVKEYGWEDRTVHPYSYPEKVTRILEMCGDYYGCTECSRSLLIALWNGLTDILNHWEEYHKQPDVAIRLLTGKNAGEVKVVKESTAQDYIEFGWAELA